MAAAHDSVRTIGLLTCFPLASDWHTKSAMALCLPKYQSRAAARAAAGTTSCEEGTFGVFDVVGFTTLSERLERLGPVGAELTTDAIDGVLGPAVEAVLAVGGDVMTFGGDAISVYVTGPDHERRAARCAAEIQRVVRRVGRLSTDGGPVRIKVSGGLHCGRLTLVCARTEHYAPTFVTGPLVTRAVGLNGDAGAGEIRLSAELAERLPSSWVVADAPDRPRLQIGRFRTAQHATARAPGPDAAPEERLSPVLRRSLSSDRGAEHRPSAVAFAALPGTDALDGDELARRATAFVNAVEAMRETFGICALDTDVGADQIRLMLTAGAPVLSDRDEERLLLALHDLAGRGLGVRLGANRGRVFAGEVGHQERATYTLMGDAVNVAARLTAQSEPDAPLVANDLLVRSRRRFASRGARRLTLKNRREPVTAVILGPPLGDAAGELGGDTPATMPLLGRQTELSTLLGVVRDGGALVIQGEPGAGKSRLVAEAVSAAGDRRVLHLAGNPYATSSPYAPFGQLAQQAVRAVGDVDESLRQTQVHAEVVRRLAAEPPLLVIAEDAHWFDQASLDLTAELATIAADRGWGVVATSRTELTAMSWAPTLTLGPLDDAAARRLAVDVAGDVPLTDAAVADLVRRSGGNPLFLRELVVASAMQDLAPSDLSDTLEQVLGARIDELAPEDRRLLREASVAGHDTDLELLGEALGDARAHDPDVWVGLRGLASVTDGRLQFDHDLVRAVAYAGLPYGRRRQLHARFADLLADRAGADVAVVARHYTVAERHAESWQWSRRAATQARESAAWVEAAGHLSAALRAADRMQPRPDIHDVAPVAEALGDVCERLGRTDDARRAYRRALAAANRPRDVSRIRRQQARVEERAGRYRSAYRLYGDALRAVEPAGTDEDDERAAAQLGRSFIRWQQGRLEDSRRLAELALALATAKGAEKQMAQAHLQLEMAYGELGLPGRAEHAEEALRLFAATADYLGLANLLLNLGVSAYNESDWETALDWFESAADAYRRAGDVIGEAIVTNNRAEILIDQGRLDEAAQCLDDARRVFRATRYEIGVAATTSARSRVALRNGDVESAARLNAEARAEFERLGAHELVVDADARAAEQLATYGDPAEAVKVCTKVREEVDNHDGLPVVAIAARRYLAVALARSGQPESALTVIDEALARARTAGSLHEVALALALRAHLVGEPMPAEAQEIAERLGIADHALLSGLAVSQ